MKIIALMMAGMAACGASQAEPSRSTPAPSGAGIASVQQEQLVPAGYGTLKQDQFTVSLRSGPLLVKVTPLDEAVIRLAAPDTYQKLHALAEARRAELGPMAAGKALFLVSLFSYQPDVTFTAEDLQLTHQGRLIQAARIAPITASWGQQRLEQQTAALAIYVFDGPFAYDQPITVHFGMEQSDAWGRIVQLLEEERGKVRARAASRSSGSE